MENQSDRMAVEQHVTQTTIVTQADGIACAKHET